MVARISIIASLLFIFTACSEEDSICDCIRAGKKVEELTAKVLQSGQINRAMAKKIEKLKMHQEKVCEPFKTMGGPEMKKRMETCEE